MSNAEEGIAKTQLKGGDAVGKRQAWSIAYLDERIFIYFGAIAFLGLCVVWATAKSAWLLYGSFVAVIVLVVLWGVARIKRIERIKQERAAQARAMQSEESG